jgi:hypothetical protein
MPCTTQSFGSSGRSTYTGSCAPTSDACRMSPAETTSSDPTLGVAPAPHSAAPWRLVSVRADDAFRLDVVFVDGTAGVVHLREFIEGPSVVGTVFEPLRDTDYFRQVRLELGAVAWPNGADLAPDAMYDAIRSTGEWVVAA